MNKDIRKLTLINRNGEIFNAKVEYSDELKKFLDEFNDINGDNEHNCVAVAYEYDDETEKPDHLQVKEGDIYGF